MSKQRICTNCGFTGKPKKVIKGSIFIEIILWIAFLIPGVVYSIWRHTTKQKVCRKCGAPNMIPEDSPKAKQIQQQLSSAAQGDGPKQSSSETESAAQI